MNTYTLLTCRKLAINIEFVFCQTTVTFPRKVYYLRKSLQFKLFKYHKIKATSGIYAGLKTYV